MDDIKIILNNGIQSDVKGIFYIYNSKYYFMYTLGENVDTDYIQLYIGQVCKEIQNTTSGPKETGYMLGIEIQNKDEWANVQKSISRIVDSKKSGVSSSEIQNLPISMLVNLKIVSSNKFKLLASLAKEVFGLNFGQKEEPIKQQNDKKTEENNDVIIDYRTKFFEEQDKNKELEEEIKKLREKLDSIKSII